MTRGLTDYRVWRAETAADARSILRQQQPDLIILDLRLPDIDGLVFCTWLRSEAARVPIITCAQSGTSEAALSLRLGADDVVLKPVSVTELESRIVAVLRRITRTEQENKSALLQLGTLCVDVPRWRVTLDSRRLHLTPTEFQLLAYLAQHAGELVSREDVARNVWGNASMSRSRTIDAYVRRVRRKLSGRGAPTLVNIHGFGFMIAAPIVTAA